MMKFGRITSFCLIPLLLLAACASPSSDVTSLPPATTVDNASEISTPAPTPNPNDDDVPRPPEDAYPVTSTNQDSGYIAPPSELELLAQPSPPNPEVSLPAASEAGGVIGGVLIQQIDDVGFVPLEPEELMLGEVLYTDTGERAYVSAGDQSIKAQLFQTGVFIFQDVPPGEYGLVVDLGFTQFIVEDEAGGPTIITVTAGEVIDLGQLITGGNG